MVRKQLEVVAASEPFVESKDYRSGFDYQRSNLEVRFVFGSPSAIIQLVAWTGAESSSQIQARN
jgi:hypothetical protein